MPCDSRLLEGQSLSERKAEVKAAVTRLSELLAAGKVKPVVGKEGAIAFAGWNDQDRRRITDACAYRQIMAKGSALARAQIAKAEQLAGRSVDRRVLAAGVHSHDDGRTFHHEH